MFCGGVGSTRRAPGRPERGTMTRLKWLAVLLAAGVLGFADSASAQCPTLLACTQELVEKTVDETEQKLEDTVAELLARPEVVLAVNAVEDVPGGKAVVCDLQGRWSASTGVSTGPSRCTRQMYTDTDDGRNGATNGTFSIPLVKRYTGDLNTGCGFSLASPTWGSPGAYGVISQPNATYNVHLGALGPFGWTIRQFGGAGNNAGGGAWWDEQNWRGTSWAAYVLNAEPVAVLGGTPTTDCSDQEWFVNIAVALFVV